VPGSLAAVLAILRGRSFGAPMQSGILGAFPRARSAGMGLRPGADLHMGQQCCP